jgi:hypothetical protein
MLAWTTGAKDGQQLHGGIDEVAPQISLFCGEADSVRAVDDQRQLRCNTVGISGGKLGSDSREPRPHFLFVVRADDPARMVPVRNLDYQIEERTAAIGGARDPLSGRRLLSPNCQIANHRTRSNQMKSRELGMV